ncbi:MAG: citrate/2-methylcitrate synthase, partial [bacterium]
MLLETRQDATPGATIVSIDALIASLLHIPENQVTEALEYQAIAEWDSLAHVGLMLGLENAFGREIDSDLMLELTSVTAIREYARRFSIDAADGECEPKPQTTTPEAGRDSVQVHRGLAGVAFDRSETTLIDGQGGMLLYRGYSIHDLAEQSSFEETSYLLLYGELPTRAELASFDAALKAARAIPPALIDVVRSVRAAHPTAVLRSAVSAMVAFDDELSDDSAE